MLRTASPFVPSFASLFALLCASTQAQTPPPAPPAAASAPSTADDAQKIVVTGTKRKQAQQETTQSVSVLSERDTIGMHSGFDIFTRLPNVTLQSDAWLPTVRGLDGNGVATGGGGAVSGANPRMSNYVDGVARTYGAAPDGQGSFWDMAQIEVYRGAQSTQLGQNSMAGALVQTTNDPKFKDEFAVQVGARDKRATVTAALMVNKAFGEQFAMRATAEASDGKNAIDYSGATATGLSAEDRDELGRTLYGRYRFKALFTPIDSLALKLTVEQERRRNPYTPDSASNSGRRDIATISGSFDSDNRIIALNGRYDIDREWLFDAVLSQQRAHTQFGPPVVGNPDPAAFLDFTFRSTEIAFEPKLIYNSAQGRSGAVVGAFVKTRERDDIGQPGSNFELTADDRASSRSLFADATFQLAPAWDLLAAARYLDDRQKRNFSGQEGQLAFGFDERNRVFLPKLGATFHASADASVSVVAYKGYNGSGGGVSFLTFTPYTFDKESAQTIEIVSRTQWLDRTLTANANLFFTRLKDTQASGIGPGGPDDGIYVNIAKARTQGAELDLLYRPGARADNLRFALGLLDTKIVDFGSAANNANNGNELGLAPRVTASLGGAFELMPGLVVGGDAAFSSQRFTDYSNLPQDRLPSYVVANLHAQYRTGGFTFTGYVNNVFDRFVQFSRFADFNQSYVNDPRTLGVNVRFEY
jgi:iron complex outermembrane recepter protein